MTQKFNPARFDCFSIRRHPHRDFIQQVLASTFDSVRPYYVVKTHLQKHDIPAAKRLFAFGLGKAALAMTHAIADEISLTDSLIVTKHASQPNFQPAAVLLGGHPIPNRLSLQAGVEAKKFVSRLKKDDLLICLISGGGSALLTAPTIPLDELQRLTAALLKSGASIDEINTIRRHLDELKGGGLIQLANGAKIISLILSDVVGDSLEAIASGITAPDSTTKEDAMQILSKYKLGNKIYAWKETLKADNPLFERVENRIIAGNSTALDFARSQISKIWGESQVKIINNRLQGEASEAGVEIAKRFKTALQTMPRPFCLLAGGEATVTISGEGKGGRNQELVLAAVDELSGLENVMLISIASDGEDGPTDAAGAVATGETAARAEALGLAAADYKFRNDAYHFFYPLGDLIKTNPTGTNVNDFVFCFAF